MTVFELINQLELIEDKSKPIFGFLCHELLDSMLDILEIDELSDRVDINVNFSEDQSEELKQEFRLLDAIIRFCRNRTNGS